MRKRSPKKGGVSIQIRRSPPVFRGRLIFCVAAAGLIGLAAWLSVVLLAPSSGLERSEAKRRASRVADDAGQGKRKRPSSLRELLALAPEELNNVDLAAMNLLCAEGLQEAGQINIDSLLAKLDGWAGHVASETSRNFHRFTSDPASFSNSIPYFRMGMLAMVLQEDFGVHYSPDRASPQLRGVREPNDVFFADPKDVFLQGLLGTQDRGTCASMPVLYAAVAERLGYPVSLAAAKGHFYVRYEEQGGHLNVEATSVGFNTYADEYYRNWPSAISDDEIREFGLLRPLTRSELLGDFLCVRASCLASMRRFDEAAEAWTQAARFLPNTPALKRITERSRQIAEYTNSTNRWWKSWGELSRLEIPDNARYAWLWSEKIRLQSFMSQSTNLAVIEGSVAKVKEELALARRGERVNSDDRLTALPGPPTMKAASIPPELQVRLMGVTDESEIAAEMAVFNAEHGNRYNQPGAGRSGNPVPATLSPGARLDPPRP